MIERWFSQALVFLYALCYARNSSKRQDLIARYGENLQEKIISLSLLRE